MAVSFGTMVTGLATGVLVPCDDCFVIVGRLRVDDQYLIPAITDNTSIEFLIPTPTGAGACSMALADLLMLTHNSFIERCMGIVTQKEKRYNDCSPT